MYIFLLITLSSQLDCMWHAFSHFYFLKRVGQLSLVIFVYQILFSKKISFSKGRYNFGEKFPIVILVYVRFGITFNLNRGQKVESFCFWSGNNFKDSSSLILRVYLKLVILTPLFLNLCEKYENSTKISTTKYFFILLSLYAFVLKNRRFYVPWSFFSGTSENLGRRFHFIDFGF